MSTLTPAATGPSDPVVMHASPFRGLPATVFGWIAAAAAFGHLALVTVMARTVLGLPTWLDFGLGLVPGAVAAVLVAMAMARMHERSWVLWLAALTLVWSFGGQLVWLAMTMGLLG